MCAYDRFSRDILPENYNVNVGQLWSVSWLNVPATGYGFPSVTVQGLSGAGDNTTYPIYRHTNTYQIGDQLAIDHGSHLFRIGGEVRELQLNGALSLFTQGLSFLLRWRYRRSPRPIMPDWFDVRRGAC